MSKKINFAIREMCELNALCVMLDYCIEVGLDVFWNIYIFHVNTDLILFSVEKRLNNYHNVKIVTNNPEEIKFGTKIYGFKANITHEKEQMINSVVDLYEITACKYYVKKRMTIDLPRPNIVIGSVKIKSPVEDFQIGIWDRLSELPYNVIAVPRHPLNFEELDRLSIPSKIILKNTMGELENFYAQADLTIMGKILGATRYDYNTRDHNPLEATINSNTICGMYSDIPAPYVEFYKTSGLVHQFYDWKDIFNNIDALINDPLLPEKLKRRKKWIKKNRQKYLPCALEALGVI
jgi:hypothetical protein